MEENKVTAIDPNKYATIDKQAFIDKYGDAARKFIKEIEQAAVTAVLEQVRKEVIKDDEEGNTLTCNITFHEHFKKPLFTPEGTRNKLKAEQRKALAKLQGTKEEKA